MSGRRPRDSRRSIGAAVRAIADATPTEDEKAGLQAKFGEMIEFLQGLRSRLATMPTQSEFDDAVRTADDLDKLFEDARRRPALATALGLRPLAHRRAQQPNLDEATAVARELESLPIDAIRERLGQIPGEVQLRAVAKALGVSASSRTSRGALINQVSARISNRRGYEILGGSRSDEP